MCSHRARVGAIAAARMVLVALVAGLGILGPAQAAPQAPRGAPDDDGTRLIVGTWASVRGAERLMFQPGGQVRSCFAGGQRGNASIGRWRQLAAGRYEVEFTHTAAPDCNQPPLALRRHPASIIGQVRVAGGELALFVSGEFPPDVYRPVLSPGTR